MSRKKTYMVLAILLVIVISYWAITYLPARDANYKAMSRFIKGEIGAQERSRYQDEFDKVSGLGMKLALGYVGVAAILLVTSKND